MNFGSAGIVCLVLKRRDKTQMGQAVKLIPLLLRRVRGVRSDGWFVKTVGLEESQDSLCYLLVGSRRVPSDQLVAHGRTCFRIGYELADQFDQPFRRCAFLLEKH